MFAKAQSAYYPEFVERQRLIAQGIDPDSVVPRDAASASYRYAGISPDTVEANREVASLLGRYPAPSEVPVTPEPQPESLDRSYPAPVYVTGDEGVILAQSYPVSSGGGSYYTPSESYAASIASGWNPTAANYVGGVYAGGTSEGE
jgi:hypothetical protein